MNIYTDKFKRTISVCFVLMLIMLFFTNCSFFRSGRGDDNLDGRNQKGQTDEFDIEIAQGDPDLVNIELPSYNSDDFSSVSSIFYDPNRNNPIYLADNFIPPGVEVNVSVAAQPARTPPPAVSQPVSQPAESVPAAVSQPVTQPVSSTPPTASQPAPKPVQTTQKAPAQPVKTAAPARPATGYEARLEAAKARYDKAFEEYTQIVTGERKGNAGEALREYREAYQQYRELQMQRRN